MEVFTSLEGHYGMTADDRFGLNLIGEFLSQSSPVFPAKHTVDGEDRKILGPASAVSFQKGRRQ